MSKVKDIVLQLSGLYKIYGKKLENEIKTGDIPNHIALILDGNRRWAKRHLEKGRVVIIAAGIGSPFVTTDTAAAQRALELEADILLKATRVDGVYSEDPEKNPHAVFYPELSFETVRDQGLQVMDSTAITHCMENKMPILVFNYKINGNIERAVQGENLGTYIG